MNRIKKKLLIIAILGLSLFFIMKDEYSETKSTILPVLIIHSHNTIAKSKNSKIIDKLSYNDLLCITDMVYHEARGENIKGQTAVIHVALNRIDHDKFPKNACGVVYQKVAGKCQYSWACKHSHSKRFRQSKEYQELKFLVELLSSIPERNKIDPTRGSLYFKRIGTHSEFFKRKLIPRIAIGSHRFYVEA